MGLGFALLHRRGAGQLLHQHHVGRRIGDGEDGHRWGLLHRRGDRRGAGQLLHQHHARQVVEAIVEASAMEKTATGGDCSIVEAIVEVLASCSTSTTSALASAMESRAAG